MPILCCANLIIAPEGSADVDLEVGVVSCRFKWRVRIYSSHTHTYKAPYQTYGVCRIYGQSLRRCAPRNDPSRSSFFVFLHVFLQIYRSVPNYKRHFFNSILVNENACYGSGGARGVL